MGEGSNTKFGQDRDLKVIERNRLRLYCKNCKWFTIGRKAERCLLPDNQRHNWMGTIYLKHPDWKNYNDACVDYKKRENKENEKD